MEKGPLVSIGIPTYNRSDSYLPEALGSALGQTYGNIEVIVADNHSSDGTADRVAGFGDPRVRYIRHERNIGPNENFNFCLEQAQGDWFLLLHDDDSIDSDFLEACINAIAASPGVGMARTGTRVVDAGGRVLREASNLVGGLPADEFIRGWLRSRTSLYLCSTLFNTERLREVGGLHSRHNLFQDVIAELQVAARFGRVDLPGVKASFRQHPGELTFTSRIREWLEDSEEVVAVIRDLTGDDRLTAEARRMLAYLNFLRVSKMERAADRYRAYFETWRFFGYRHTPWRLYMNKRIKPLARRLKRRLGSSPIPAR